MKKRLSVVIEYEEGQEQPSFHADMECLGGKVVGVMFDDALARIDELEGGLAEDNELNDDCSWWVEEL